jgi:hypothetical protein
MGGAERLWGGDSKGWGRKAENESRWGGKGSRSDRVLAPHSKPRLREPVLDPMAAWMASCWCLKPSLGLDILGLEVTAQGTAQIEKAWLGTAPFLMAKRPSSPGPRPESQDGE